MQLEPVALPKVLIVEDDANVRLGCEQAMQHAGIEVLAAASVERAQTLLRPKFSGVVVADMALPGMGGLQFLQFAQRLDADMPVIMFTDEGDAALAAEAMLGGAYDFIEKPFSPEHLVKVVKRALEKRRLTLQLECLRRRLGHREDLEARLIGRSLQIETIRRFIPDVANADVDVLVLGEPGTGKELAARCLHDVSRRQKANFVALNCGGLPEMLVDFELFGHPQDAFPGARKRHAGKFECANGGTLFIDDAETMPLGTQSKLLRVLKERAIERPGSDEVIPVTFRLIAASTADLKAHVEEGRFLADLYDRLNVATIDLPPLRERREDIPALYDHFLLMAAKRYGKPVPNLAPEQLRQLTAYDWPGNIRELRNHADCRALGIVRDAGAVDATPRPGCTLSQTVETFERALITAELQRQSGNVAKSSEALGVARTTLHDKIRKYGLS